MPDLKLLFIINPHSGNSHKNQKFLLKKNINWEKEIKKNLEHKECKLEIYHVSSDNDNASVKYWIERFKPDKVIAVGGDGTLKLVAEAVLGYDIPICVFPAGSANGMSKEIGMPENPKECIDILLNGQVKDIDAVYINNKHLCIHLSDIGINAQLVKYFDENDIRGKWGYAKEVFKVLWRKRLMHVRLNSHHREIYRKAFMIVIANATMYGTGAKINPVGNIHDGLFEVIILKKLSLTELFKMLFYNRGFNPKKTEVFQAETLYIEVKRRIHFQVDGEYLGKTKSIEAVAKPKALKMVFPIFNT